MKERKFNASSGNQKGILREVRYFEIGTDHNLNAPDFQMITPGGVGIGSTAKEFEEMGAYKHYDDYYLIYLDGELVDFSDYEEDMKRLQKLDKEEWEQEREKEYKYYCVNPSYRGLANGDEHETFILAYGDAEAKVISGEKETMLVFIYRLGYNGVQDIRFNVCGGIDKVK